MATPPAFAEEIKKTGFVLENRIAQQLKDNGWTVISNKYYVDDSEETIREIDLVAYKCSKVQHLNVYTVLIVSCKKSDANVWALLAREINLKDPNSDWWPVHMWSNDKALNYKFSEPTMAHRYHKRVTELGVAQALAEPSVEVFAYQEMDKVSGRPQNDKPIFSAITSLMKAQAYELAALPGRKKLPSVYQFNLLSVADTELVRLMFDDDKIEASDLETEHYLARYIVRKRETFSRIRFIQANAFRQTLDDYTRLHGANCKWFAEQVDTFHDGILLDWKRVRVLLEDFTKKIQFEMAMSLKCKFADVPPILITWNKDFQRVDIGVPLTLREIESLNSSQRLHVDVVKAFKSVYRYEGEFLFTEDIPF